MTTEKPEYQVYSTVTSGAGGKNWIQFFPIKTLSMVDSMGDTLDERDSKEVLKGAPSEKIYGKAMGGVVRYSPWWIYGEWRKDEIRVKPVRK